MFFNFKTKNKFSSKITSKLAIVFSLILFTFTILAGSLSVSAMDFASSDSSGNINVSEEKTNLTVAGGQVNITGSTKKDLIVAGGNVTITGNVERNLIAAAGNLNISSKTIGATVRVAGGNVNFKDTVIEEDLVLAGGTVTLDNVQVKGSTYIGNSDLQVTNSKFLGNANISYETYSGDDLDAVTTGVLNVDKQDMKKVRDEMKAASEKKAKNPFGNYSFFSWLGNSGLLFGLIVILIYMASRKALSLNNIEFNKRFWIDILIGIAVLVILPIIFVLSFFALGITFTWSVWILAVSLYFISMAFAPFYLANLVKNSFKPKMSIVILSLAVWGVYFLVDLLTALFLPFALLGLVLGLLTLSGFGYMIRNIFEAINRQVDNNKKQEIVSIDAQESVKVDTKE